MWNAMKYKDVHYIRTFALSAWTLSLWNKVPEKIINIIHSSLKSLNIFPFSECTAKQFVRSFKKKEQYFDSHHLTLGKWLWITGRDCYVHASSKIRANLCKNSTLFAGKEPLCYLLQRKPSNIQVDIKMLHYLSISTCFISIDLYIWDILPSLSSRSARI